MVDVQPSGIIRLDVQRKGLAGGGQQLALPPSGHIVSPIWGDGAGAPVKVHLVVPLAGLFTAGFAVFALVWKVYQTWLDGFIIFALVRLYLFDF